LDAGPRLDQRRDPHEGRSALVLCVRGHRESVSDIGSSERIRGGSSHCQRHANACVDIAAHVGRTDWWRRMRFAINLGRNADGREPGRDAVDRHPRHV
jgi:hypothetical protein